MARQRASQARDAFARVGTAPVPASNEAGIDDSISASGNESYADVISEDTPAIITEVANAGANDSNSADSSAVRNTSTRASSRASVRASRGSGRKAGKPARRVGRPRGPERVPLTIRILAETDARLTAAVDATGDSPQYIVDKALAAYLDALGIGR
jgi:hypothetical protein